MKSARYIGRVGGLAIALGTGAWLASVPWSAAADTDWSVLNLVDPGGIDLVGPAAADPSGLNIDISYDGKTLLHMGDATAHSGTNDLAIAYGDGSTADAGYGSTPSGLSLVGQHDSAFADGAGSTANAGGGDGDYATASNGGTADSGFFAGSGVSATGGSDDVARASGAGSTADALGQSDNTATASDGGTADSGFYDEPGHLFNGGIGDSASATGTGSLADAGFGDSDTAEVIGAHSTALAGGFDSITGTAGSNDIAEAFGADQTANAATGSNLFVIEPTDFTTAAGGDVGLADVLHDLGLNGLAPALESLLNLF
jgi:hypothetical protein